MGMHLRVTISFIIESNQTHTLCPIRLHLHQHLAWKAILATKGWQAFLTCWFFWLPAVENVKNLYKSSLFFMKLYLIGNISFNSNTY